MQVVEANLDCVCGWVGRGGWGELSATVRAEMQEWVYELGLR